MSGLYFLDVKIMRLSACCSSAASYKLTICILIVFPHFSTNQKTYQFQFIVKKYKKLATANRGR